MKDLPWLLHYPDGIPHEIDADCYSSLLDLMEEAFEKYADRSAFENMGTLLSFREIDEQSKAFAAYLQYHTMLEPGDSVIVQMPNLLQYPIAIFGILRAGMVVVNTNPLYTEREMLHQFRDSGAKAIVIVSNFASKLEAIIDKTQIKEVILTQVGDMLSFPKNFIVNLAVKHVKKMVPSYGLPDSIPFKRVITIGKATAYNRPNLSGEDVAFLQYTGGTTGVSKGAVLTHRNIVANLEQNAAWMGNKLGYDGEIVITPLPLYHIFSLTVNCMFMLKIGAKNVLITNPRDLPEFIKELKKHPFTTITGVNTLYNALLQHSDFAEIDFSSLKVAIGGGMAVQRAVAERWKDVTNTPLIEGYGLTETSPVLSCNPLNGKEQIGTIGQPLPSTEVRVMDENGYHLPEGKVGEICARGPQVMKSYWNNEAETKRAFFPGNWFRTGDIGTSLPEGFFKIVDRKKDMILVSGFNVYPNEVEDIISAHPKVSEVAVIGIADDYSTEAVKAFVVKKDQSLTQEELKSFCLENLTRYKVPKHYEFRTELPKSYVGKILRRHLKKEEDTPKADTSKNENS